MRRGAGDEIRAAAYPGKVTALREMPPSRRADLPLAPAREQRASYVDVVTAIAEADVRARFGRGAGRFVKWLLDPFALLGVYILLVTFVLNRPGVDPGLSLACSIVPFQLVISTVVTSTNAVNARRSVLTNMAFERTLIPLAVTVAETLAFLASLFLLVLMMATYGVAPTAEIAWIPVLLVVNVVLAVSFAYPAALFGVWFPEMRAFAVSLMRTLYFVAPGLVPLSEASHRAQTLLKLNPLTGLFQGFRTVLVDGSSPAPWMILYPLAFAAVLLALVVPLYRREQAWFAKVVG